MPEPTQHQTRGQESALRGGDLETVKARNKAAWTAGDFGKLAKFAEGAAEEFVARRNIQPGMRVLDVGCGTGNLAIPAARARADVTGVDIAPNLLAQARQRAEREGLDIDFEEGDVDELPYEDGAFDLVASMFGAIFAPRPQRAAAELLRVCRPGGQIAMANWTPDSFIGQVQKTIAKYIPQPPNAPQPLEWGEESTVRSLLGGGVKNLNITRQTAKMAYPFDVAQTVEFERVNLGPAVIAFENLSKEDQANIRRDLEALHARHNKAKDGTVLIESEYLDVTAIRA